MKLSGKKLKSMLFMGDFSGNVAIDRLNTLLKKEPDLFKADVWVLPHHGATMLDFSDKKSKSLNIFKELRDNLAIYEKIENAGKICNIFKKFNIPLDIVFLVGAKEIVISSNIKGSYAHPRCDTVKGLFFNPGPCPNEAPPKVSSGIPNGYVQCWSKVNDQRKLYKAEFCKWNHHDIRQTTKEDYDGNVIWKDVVTDLKKQT